MFSRQPFLNNMLCVISTDLNLYLPKHCVLKKFFDNIIFYIVNIYTQHTIIHVRALDAYILTDESLEPARHYDILAGFRFFINFVKII